MGRKVSKKRNGKHHAFILVELPTKKRISTDGYFSKIFFFFPLAPARVEEVVFVLRKGGIVGRDR